MPFLWRNLDLLKDEPFYSKAMEMKRGTIRAADDFNAGKDVVALRDAMKGAGTKEKLLIHILTNRSNAQRQLISKAYQEITRQTLLHDLKGETRGDFEDALVALITPPAMYDCAEVTRAMKGSGTKEDILIEIFASRSNEQIKALAHVYSKEKLIHDLKREVSGDFGDALLLLAQGKRDDDDDVDVGKAKLDAMVLYKAGENKWGTNESKFIEILCLRSVPQLRRTFIEYKNQCGKTLLESIEDEMKGDMEKLMVAIVKCVNSVSAYFAEQLHLSMRGGRTDEATLTRIMVSRSEMDLRDIKDKFKTIYDRSLRSAIESDLSGSFCDCMKAICGADV